MGHQSKHKLSLLELTKALIFLFFPFFSFILSFLNKFQVSTMQVVQLCILLCALMKSVSGSHCWLPSEYCWVLSFVGVVGGPFYSLIGFFGGPFQDYWSLEIFGLYECVQFILISEIYSQSFVFLFPDYKTSDLISKYIIWSQEEAGKIDHFVIIIFVVYCCSFC